MARLFWTEPALTDLDAIAGYIALDNPLAASRFVEKVFARVERLKRHPKSGKRPSELPRTHCREVLAHLPQQGLLNPRFQRHRLP